MKRYLPIIIIAGGAVLIAGTALALVLLNKPSQNPPIIPITPSTVTPSPRACTEEAMQCPDGSYVGRTGPNCEFTPCPSANPNPTPTPTPNPTPTPTPAPTSNCTSDSQCPAGYACQASEGYGTVSPDSTVQSPTFTTTKGECKLKVAGQCSSDSQCLAGLVCHNSVCTEPVNGSCSGPGDSSCATGYQCIQDCGAPVAREGDLPPPYHCVVDEVASKPRNCPICLASNVMIDTPNGEIPVSLIGKGQTVWSTDKNGKKIASKVIAVSKIGVPITHKVTHLILSDLRELWLSPQHPLYDGHTAGQLNVGDLYDGAFVEAAELIPYWDKYTYDLLPNSETGFYWGNGILLGSTLK